MLLCMLLYILCYFIICYLFIVYYYHFRGIQLKLEKNNISKKNNKI